LENSPESELKMAKPELLKIVDRLEEMWLRDWALEVAEGQGKHLPADKARQLYRDHIKNPLHQSLAHKQFAGLRDQIEAEFLLKDVLHILQKALERPATEQS